VHTLDIPVCLLDLAVEIKGIGQMLIEQGDHGLAQMGGQVVAGDKCVMSRLRHTNLLMMNVTNLNELDKVQSRQVTAYTDHFQLAYPSTMVTSKREAQYLLNSFGRQSLTKPAPDCRRSASGGIASLLGTIARLSSGFEDLKK